MEIKFKYVESATDGQEKGIISIVAHLSCLK